MYDGFKIADFLIQPQINSISKEGSTVRLEPKVMELLLYLARHAGMTVEKEHLLGDLWAGDNVTEEVLTNAVWKLRHVFQDDSRNPHFIETIQKKGYRLIAPVSLLEHARIVATAKHITVGHEKERAELRESFMSAVSGHGLLVCISGEAGIGKTTCVEQFLLEVGSHHCIVGRGKCSERLAGTGAYLPILEALESLVQSESDTELMALLRHVAPSWYVQVFPHADDSAILSARTGGSSRERLKRELTAFLRDVSHRLPLLLFFDDIHWADSSSIDMLTYLCDRCGSMRILILAAYRGEYLLPKDHAFHNLKLGLQARG
jgi:DNA-binding winged helix-turn-helix (wHTH) protein